MPPDIRTYVIDSPDAVDPTLNELSRELVGARPHHLLATVRGTDHGYTFALTCPSSEGWERFIFVDAAVQPCEGRMRVSQFLAPYLKAPVQEDRS